MAAFALRTELNYTTYCDKEPCGLGMAEPTTTITDFILAAELLVIAGVMLFHNLSIISILWSLAWVLLAIAFLCGAINHGFAREVRCSDRDQYCLRYDIYWILALLPQCYGIALMFVQSVFLIIKPLKKQFQLLLWGIFFAIAFIYTLSVIIAIIVGAKFVLEFQFGAFFHLPCVLGALVFFSLPVCCRYRRQSTENKKLSHASILALTGWIVCIASFVWQVSGIGFHKHFNHNDIFHVIVMIGFGIFAAGVIPLVVARAREDKEQSTVAPVEYATNYDEYHSKL